MRVEEVQEFLNSDQGKELLNQYVEPILRHKETILSEKKKLKENFSNVEQEKFSMEKQLQEMSSQLQLVSSQLQNLQKENFGLKAETIIQEKLKKLQIKPELQSLLLENFISKSEFDDSGKLIIQGEDQETFFENFSKSETYRHIATPPNNSGSGAIGSEFRGSNPVLANSFLEKARSKI